MAERTIGGSQHPDETPPDQFQDVVWVEADRWLYPAGQTVAERVKAILDGTAFTEPVEPIDLQAPVQLVEVDFQSGPDDGIGRTLELREALARQEGRDA